MKEEIVGTVNVGNRSAAILADGRGLVWADELLFRHDGKVVRVTVEVLEPSQAAASPPGRGRAPAETSVVPGAAASAGSDDWTSCAAPHAPKGET